MYGRDWGPGMGVGPVGDAYFSRSSSFDRSPTLRSSRTRPVQVPVHHYGRSTIGPPPPKPPYSHSPHSHSLSYRPNPRSASLSRPPPGALHSIHSLHHHPSYTAQPSVNSVAERFERLYQEPGRGTFPSSYHGYASALPSSRYGARRGSDDSSEESNEGKDSVSALRQRRQSAGLYQSRSGAASMPDVPSYSSSSHSSASSYSPAPATANGFHRTDIARSSGGQGGQSFGGSDAMRLSGAGSGDGQMCGGCCKERRGYRSLRKRKSQPVPAQPQPNPLVPIPLWAPDPPPRELAPDPLPKEAAPGPSTPKRLPRVPQIHKKVPKNVPASERTPEAPAGTQKVPEVPQPPKEVPKKPEAEGAESEGAESEGAESVTQSEGSDEEVDVTGSSAESSGAEAARGRRKLPPTPSPEPIPEPRRPSPKNSASTKASSATSRTSPTTGLVGLVNIGNTCFMNSMLQCLSNTRAVRDVALSRPAAVGSAKTRGAVVRAFSELMEELWRPGQRGAFTPSAFKAAVQQCAPRFSGYGQHDSQEFLRYLLWGLHDELNVGRPSAAGPMVDDALPPLQKAQQTWERYLRIDRSPIVEIFVGQLRSDLKCTHCGWTSSTFDPFWDLSLPLPSSSGSRTGLEQCLSAFTKEEVLDGEERPKCEKCAARRKCTKKLSVQRFPSVLVLHLKRFSGERYRSRHSALVTFPQRTALEGVAAAGVSAPSYALYAVSNHMGTPSVGHYTAYARHPEAKGDGDGWHLFDDSRVSQASPDDVVTEQAYVLFYQRL